MIVVFVLNRFELTLLIYTFDDEEKEKDETDVQGGDNDRELLNVRLTYTR